MFDMKEYVSCFQSKGVYAAKQYRMNNAPKKIYKFTPFYDKGNMYLIQWIFKNKWSILL